MGVDYSVAIGVGVEDSKITYEVLTDEAKSKLRSILFETSSLEDLEAYREDSDLLEDALSELFDEVKHGEDFLYDLGLTKYEGNLFSGRYGYCGVGIYLNIDTIKEDVEKAVQEFKKVVKLEPELFSGVLIS